MKKIGEGVTSDIFEVDSNTVMKLYKPIFRDIAESENFTETEYKIMNMISNYSVPIPKPIEQKIKNGRNGYTMEKIKGSSLRDLVENNIFAYELYAILFGRLHCSINKINLEYTNDFPDIKERLYNMISGSPELFGGYFKSIMSLFDELPDGNNLCHNDFHLGNVIANSNKFCFIDWDGTGKGDYHCDAARTVIELKFSPAGIIFGNKSWYIREKFTDKYLSAYNQHIELDFNLLLKWEIIRAAEFIVMGAPIKQSLWEFIENNI
jgi:thiamine kinase-like enzyme